MRHYLRSLTRGSKRAIALGIVVLALTIGTLPVLAAADPTPTTSPTQRISAAYDAFSAANFAGFQVNGDAIVTGGIFRLTPSAMAKKGSFYTKQLMNLTDAGFSSFFTINMHDPGPTPADGICFVVQPSSSSALTSGGGMGYAGIDRSVAVEFDTYENDDDPSDSHVGINVNGSMVSVVTADPPASMVDTAWHVWVDFNHDASLLTVYMSTTMTRPATPLLSYTIDIPAITGDGVYVGLSAATGGAYEVHDVSDLYFNNAYIPGSLDPANINYIGGPGSVNAELSRQYVPSSGLTTVTAVLRDQNGDLMPNWCVHFSSPSAGVLGSTAATSNASGLVTTTFLPSDATTFAVRVLADGGLFYDLIGYVTHQVRFIPSGHGYIDGEATQTVVYGESSSWVEAIPDENYHFVGWSENDDLYVEGTEAYLDNVTTDTDITAIFAPDLGQPVDPAFGPTRAGHTTITWGAAENALAYRIFVGGRLVATVDAENLTYEYGKLIGPNTLVCIQAVGEDDATTDPVCAEYASTVSGFAGRIRFSGFSSMLSIESKAVIRRLAIIAKRQGFSRIDIEGFTSTVLNATPKYHAALSLRRAQVTKKYLGSVLTGLHVSDVRISAKGFGTANPVGNNKTWSGRVQNRRADVYMR